MVKRPTKRAEKASEALTTTEAPDSAPPPAPSEDKLAAIVKLGGRLASANAAIAALEAALGVAKRAKNLLESKDIPDAMMDAKISSIGLDEATPDKWIADAARALAGLADRITKGTDAELLDAMRKELPKGSVTMKVQDFCHANIAAEWEPERRKAAFDWLVDNDHEGLIKVEISALFPRGNKALADKALAAMRKAIGKKDIVIELGESVPWNTLTAFVKEEMEKGAAIPLAVLGATVGKVAKLSKK